MVRFDKERWRVVSPLLDELLDAGAVQRDQRLAQIQARDRKLARELAALLAIDAEVETGEFLKGSALGWLRTATLAGQCFGGYVLQRQLGTGSAGTVWLARRSDARSAREAVVRVIHPGILGRGRADRFRHEGGALARLRHPNIAHLIDAGVLDGQPYLVVEFVKGEPIDAWCDARSLGIDARIRVFQQVVAAITFAHAKLGVHCDLRPANVRVMDDGQIKLLDFGIARLLDDRNAVSAATDVCALGSLLFELLAGSHPTPRLSTPVEGRRASMEIDAPRMSDVARGASRAVAAARGCTPRALARSLRGDLDHVVGKALKKVPRERYASVDALGEDLHRLLAHEPVSPRADSAVYCAALFVRRHWVGVAALSAAALTLCGLLAELMAAR